MTTMLLRSILTGAAVAALAASPASASPTIDPLKPCYLVAQESQREPVEVRARGFTPLSAVDIYIDEILQDSPVVAFDSSLVGAVKAPYQESGQRTFTLRLAERGTPANTVTTTAKVTRLSVEQVPERASTGERVRFRGRGFMQAAPVYAHYVFAGKSRRTVRLGMPKGDCGTFSVKRKQFPFKSSPRVGVWTIQFDQFPHYDPRAAVRVPMTVKVRRTIKPRSVRVR